MKTTTISTSDYDVINTSGNLNINLVSGKEGEIKISAEENLIEYIEVFVENSELTIKIKKGYNLSPSVRSKMFVSVPFEKINDIKLSGSGDINTTDTIQTNTFSILNPGATVNGLYIKSTPEGIFAILCLPALNSPLG